MNPFEMVVIIVITVMIASVLRARYQSRGSDGEPSAQEKAQSARLQEEVKALKDRVKVLERIAVEKENSLSAQIDDLRDR
jgi:cell division protein FtsB